MFTRKVVLVAKGGQKINEVALVDLFFRLKTNQYENANIADCLKSIWKFIKQYKLTVEL